MKNIMIVLNQKEIDPLLIPLINTLFPECEISISRSIRDGVKAGRNEDLSNFRTKNVKKDKEITFFDSG